MTTIELYVSGASAEASVLGCLTAGAVGVQVRCCFDDAWNGLVPRLVVRCAEAARSMQIDADGRSVLPWECLIAGMRLQIGVDGWDAEGTMRIPTKWADCGRVLDSTAVDAQESGQPTPDLAAQIAAQAQAAARDAESARASAAEALAVKAAAERGDYKGEKGDKGDRGERGPQGDRGNPGADGVTPELRIGSVTTVSPVTPAGAAIAGSREFPLLNLELPKGEPGERYDDTELRQRIAAQNWRVKNLEAAVDGKLSRDAVAADTEYRFEVPEDVLPGAVVQKIGGSSIVRNQLADESIRYVTQNINARFYPLRSSTISNHAYLVALNITQSGTGNCVFTINNASEYTPNGGVMAFAGTTGFVSGIIKKDAAKTHLYVYLGGGSAISWEDLVIIDLTKMFGADIADTITTPEEAYALGCPREYVPYNPGEIVSADVESVQTFDVYTPYHAPIVYQIPAAVRDLPGYGWSAGDVYNEVDYENKQYIQRVGNYTLNGTEAWVKTVVTGDDYQGFAIASNSINAYNGRGVIVNTRFPHSGIETVPNTCNQNTGTYGIRFTIGKDIAPNGEPQELKNWLAAHPLEIYYRITEPIVTDISDLIPEDFLIEVERGGSITMEQAGGTELPVPAEILYKVDIPASAAYTMALENKIDTAILAAMMEV